MNLATNVMVQVVYMAYPTIALGHDERLEKGRNKVATLCAL